MSGARLLLIGAGHAHLFVLEALARGHVPAGETVLVAPHARQVYSGMVPGFVEGRYPLDQISFDLPALAARGGGRFVPGRVVRIDANARRVELADGTLLEYDVASVAVGGAPGGAATPGARQHARFVKPIDETARLPEALDALAGLEDPEPRRLVVVGAGEAGIELALTARTRLDRRGAREVIITLVDRVGELFGGRTPARADLAERVLRSRDITLRLGSAAVEVGPDFVRLTDGGVLQAGLVIWATGTEAPTLFRDSRLPCDPHGYLQVEDTLTATGTPGLLGAGDAVSVLGVGRVPKAGVYAVRMAPTLVRNLARALRGESRGMDHYRPRPRHLSLLNTGDGRAILFYGEFALASRWAMRLKDRIDRRFMTRFQRR
jgi:NADH dehydrogenase FAD-containing subunit